MRGARGLLANTRAFESGVALRLPPQSKIAAALSHSCSFVVTSDKPRRFLEAAQEIHALHRLAAGALDEVIFGADDDEPAGARVEAPADFDDVGAGDILR